MHAHVQHDHEAPVPRTAVRRSPARETEVHEVAERVLARLGRPAALPFRERLERSFGTRLADVTVRVGAADEVARLGGGAATAGGTVVFGNDEPSLHEVAHEVTHVLQNRGGAPSTGRGVSAPQDAAEHEAESAGAAVTSGQPVQVSAAPAAPLQLGPLDWLKRKPAQPGPAVGKGDADVRRMTALSSGTANQVYKVKYGSGIGDHGSRQGYFKPDGTSDYSAQGNSARAVASSRVDKLLGFNQLSEEEFATHTVTSRGPRRRFGRKVKKTSQVLSGSVSADLGDDYAPLSKNAYTPLAGKTREQAEQAAEDEGFGPDNVKAVGKGFARISGSDVHDFDFSRPETQKSMMDLQLQDAITGQVDRHGGNIMMNDKTGRVMGIDNDQAFDRGRDGDGFSNLGAGAGHYRGMPELVDAGSAERILGTKSRDFRKAVRGSKDDPERLSKQSADEARKRFKAVKGQVKQLKRDGKLVDQWDDTTFARATDPKGPESYLRIAHDLRTMGQGKNAHGITTVPAPPSREEALQQALQEAGLVAPRRRLGARA